MSDTPQAAGEHLKAERIVSGDHVSVENVNQELVEEHGELQDELRAAVESFERCADHLKRDGKWEMAAEAYGKLSKKKICEWRRYGEAVLTEEEKQPAKVDSLLLKYKQVSALMCLNNPPDAELLAIADEVWEGIGFKEWARPGGQLLLDASSSEVREIHKDYCDILRRSNKHEEAEREYILVWYFSDWWASEDRKDDWRYDTAYRIGLVMEEQGRHEEAAIWYKKVVDWALGKQPIMVDAGARSAVKLASERGGSNHRYHLIELLEPIWKAGELEGESDDVLTCGHELGRCLLGEKRDDDAERILIDVLERRSKRNEHAIATAELLVTAYNRLEKNEELEKLYSQILDTLGVDKKQEKSRYQSELGHVQFVNGKQDDEDTLKEALRGLEQDNRSGGDTYDKLQCELVLGQLLMKKGDLMGAERLFEGAWDEGGKSPQTTLRVRAGELHGSVLIQQGKYDEAVAVLKRVVNSKRKSGFEKREIAQEPKNLLNEANRLKPGGEEPGVKQPVVEEPGVEQPKVEEADGKESDGEESEEEESKEKQSEEEQSEEEESEEEESEEEESDGRQE